MNLNQLSFLGDAVFELLVREYIIENNIVKLNELQTNTLKYVPAKKQASFLKYLTETDKLNEEELDLVRRGRNLKTHKSPKNCDMITYKYATAFEILIGYLYQTDKERLKEIFKEIISLEEVTC